LYQIQSQYPDIVTPQSALLPEEPDLPTPVADPEKIKIAKFLAPDDVAEQQKIVRSLIESPGAADKVTNAMVEAATIYPYPEGANDADKVAIDKQRRDYLLKRTLKEEGDVVIKMPPGPEAGQEKLYEFFVTEEKRIKDDAREAENDLIQSHQMLRILQEGGFRTGALAAFGLQAKKIGIALFPGLEEKLAPGIAEAEAYTAFGNRAALSLKKMMPGPLSDKDIQFIMNSAPGLARTPEGNLILLSLMIRRNERRMLYGRLATKYAQQSESGFVDRGFDEWVNEQPEWDEYRVVTEGYQQGNLVTEILTTIDADDEQGTQKLDALPNYTVYYLERDGKKEIEMKMPGTATPDETVPEPTVQTVQPTPTETGLPYFDAIKAWEKEERDVLALLKSGLLPITEDMAPRIVAQQRELRRAIELYQAGKY